MRSCNWLQKQAPLPMPRRVPLLLLQLAEGRHSATLKGLRVRQRVVYAKVTQNQSC